MCIYIYIYTHTHTYTYISIWRCHTLYEYMSCNTVALDEPWVVHHAYRIVYRVGCAFNACHTGRVCCVLTSYHGSWVNSQVSRTIAREDRKTDSEHHHHHHHPEGVVYRNWCLNSGTVAVSNITSRRWWGTESLSPKEKHVSVMLGAPSPCQPNCEAGSCLGVYYYMYIIIITIMCIIINILL